MDDPEVRRLLAVVMAYDNRKPGDAAVLAWGEAARRARWTYSEALEAVHQHYATETSWLMPGHVTARIRAARPVHTMSQPAAPAPDPAGQRRLADAVAGGFREIDQRPPEPRATRSTAKPELAVACPGCAAAAGQPCTRPGRKGADVDAVVRGSSHPSRIAAVMA